jgi:hypothetical protein
VAGSPPFVGTLSLESDEGTCDLNTDGDTDDAVVRWVEAVTPVRPYLRDPRELVATVDVNGGAGGLAELGDLLVAVVSEADHEFDYDLDGLRESELLAWMRPRDGTAATWSFLHRVDKTGTVSGSQLPEEDVFVGSDWMAETPRRDFLLSSLQESVYGRQINEDGYMNDSVPTWGSFSSGLLRLNWATLPVEAGNAGMVIAGDVVFYRSDELASGEDGNEDGDFFDKLLVTVPFPGGRRETVGTLNDFSSPSVQVDPGGALVGAAFVSDDRMERQDLNGDNDLTDFVVRWFRF